MRAGPGSEGPGKPPDLSGAGDASAGSVPVEQPKAEFLRLERPLRVLMVYQQATSWALFMAQAWHANELIHYTCYSIRPPEGEATCASANEQPVTTRPTGLWFEEQKFDVLVWVDADPALLPDDFWMVVVERVHKGTLGLWVHPGMPPMPGGKAAMPPIHPLLEHPILKGLLPIETVAPIQGPDLPGFFGEGAPFAITSAGEKSAVSRMVAWPEWSRRVWAAGADGPFAWRTKFCYPVTKIRAGATTLVEVRPAKGAAIPALVQGPLLDGRVLWFGTADFGEKAYRDPDSSEKWHALFHNGVVWLAGRE